MVGGMGEGCLDTSSLSSGDGIGFFKPLWVDGVSVSVLGVVEGCACFCATIGVRLG
jgi:hypothetical protein